MNDFDVGWLKISVIDQTFKEKIYCEPFILNQRYEIDLNEFDISDVLGVVKDISNSLSIKIILSGNRVVKISASGVFHFIFVLRSNKNNKVSIKILKENDKDYELLPYILSIDSILDRDGFTFLRDNLIISVN